MDASTRSISSAGHRGTRRQERMAAMSVTAHDPLVSYCAELAPPRDRGKSAPSVEYAESTVRALTILARRYGPVDGAREKANPVWLDAGGVERAEALREAMTAWGRRETPASLRGHRLLSLDYEAVMDGV